MSPKAVQLRAPAKTRPPETRGKVSVSDNGCSIPWRDRIQIQDNWVGSAGLTADERTTIVTKFLSKIKIGPDCWLWTGKEDGHGYGFFSYQLRGKQVRIGAHRFMLFLKYESVSDGMVAAHVCDNPICVRQDHLFLGTQGDNLRDAAQKGRLHAPRARKLTQAERLTIYLAPRDRGAVVDLARRYGVSKACISLIRKGRWIGAPTTLEPVKTRQLEVRGEVS